ncbi:ATP-dependent exoDNAse (exonuclease V) beta subunit (contains helicase and exonuclease domains) [Maribacter orientalis]|uniref:DNA 3'-5' helicase n=1 Tax=Maribacter orientalis TaxID=228957 RepID=A0A1H7LB23_9FLAO|nr:UvrD-helicase domain-containing protein [Maribacter orientalis]SEK96193.1 ATP-dependent exoDNAse (exonuclease V) beta subunit (contains helicase and exonuclease domains) [Maribacter orientalis]
MSSNSFTIYNASAGSGKTYALAKVYLKILLASPQNFRKILAITFTNKAVNEMKHRILNSLYEFSITTSLEEASPLFNDLINETQFTFEDLPSLSKLRLKQILHNYAFFDISTIDKFTHRLIRTFAKDLKIPQNFEVILDKDLLLHEAVERVIGKAGIEAEYTKILLEFSREKIADDRSWDISYDLLKIGNLLFDENNSAHIIEIQSKTLVDFLNLRDKNKETIKNNKRQIIELANEILNLLNSNNLEFKHFSGSYFPKFILKISKGELISNFSAAWNQNFETTSPYNKSAPTEIKLNIDNIHAELSNLFNSIKDLIKRTSYLLNINRNIVPFALLNAIQKELKIIQEEKDQLSISEFNTLIAKEIKDQPAPFIYERLGEKYRHYFIDEFQDTSQMQWENLIPLIGNAMEGEDESGNIGSLFLVGDPKQAIYRWRGGKAEQFLELATHQNHPFTIKSELVTLPKNYRSNAEIINFNNNFFQSISPFLENTLYQEFFQNGNQQEVNQKEGGYVNLTLLEEENDEQYALETLAAISRCLAQGYTYSDICIIIRKKKHGSVLANFLMQNEIPVVSPDSLLLNGSPKAIFLVQLIRYMVQPTELEIQFEILNFLSEEKEDRHAYIFENLNHLDTHLLEEYGFDSSKLRQASVFDGLAYAIKIFDLIPNSDAHLSAFMDLVFDVEQKYGSDMQSFLDYWDKKGNSSSISTPENLDSVQIMTIHKSKGLEFPVVIFPYANSNVFEEIDPKLWLPVDKEEFLGFSEVLINKKQEVKEYGELESLLYELDHQKLQLDAFNLLYVVLTRAVNVLFIISSNNLDRKGDHNPNYYSGLFIHFLKSIGIYEQDKLEYDFGELKSVDKKPSSSIIQNNIPYIYTNKDRPDFKIVALAGILWDEGLDVAVNQGNVIHTILGAIYTTADLERALQMAIQKGFIKDQEKEEIKKIVKKVIYHQDLNHFYETGIEVLNERDLLMANGTIQRPDRVIIKDNHATIIDYKTGDRNTKYHNQLNTYAESFSNMGYIIDHKIIVYINTEIQLEYL